MVHLKDERWVLSTEAMVHCASTHGYPPDMLIDMVNTILKQRCREFIDTAFHGLAKEVGH
jgi:hypothetical protein